jgi:WD40 repeat protein
LFAGGVLLGGVALLISAMVHVVNRPGEVTIGNNSNVARSEKATDCMIAYCSSPVSMGPGVSNSTDINVTWCAKEDTVQLSGDVRLDGSDVQMTDHAARFQAGGDVWEFDKDHGILTDYSYFTKMPSGLTASAIRYRTNCSHYSPGEQLPSLPQVAKTDSATATTAPAIETHHSLFNRARVLAGGGSIAFSPDGRTIALGGPVSTLWDVDSGKQLHELASRNSRGNDYSVAFSPDGSTIASIAKGDNNIYLWNVAAGRELRALKCDCYGGFTSVSFSPDRRILATGGEGEVRIWDVPSGQQLHILEGSSETFAFSPDGRTVMDDKLDLWDVASGQKLRTLQSPAPETVSSLAFSPDGRTVAVGHCVDDDVKHQSTIELLNVADGRELHTLQLNFGCIASVAFSPDGRILAVGGAQGFTSYPDIYEVSSGRPLDILLERVDNVIRQCAGCELTSVAFSPDGQTFAAGRDGTTVLWSVPADHGFQPRE